MPQTMYGNHVNPAYQQPMNPVMNNTIGQGGVTGTMPVQPGAVSPQAGIPTPSAPTQHTVSSLSGISRPTAPLESKVEAKSIKIPDFLKNNK